jgi:hypothetical protein
LSVIAVIREGIHRSLRRASRAFFNNLERIAETGPVHDHPRPRAFVRRMVSFRQCRSSLSRAAK